MKHGANSPRNSRSSAGRKRSEERLLGSEKRALLEIDRERQASNRLQHEFLQLRQTQQEATERHVAEIAEFQKRVEELKQNLGVVEGKLQSQRDTGAEMAAQLASLRPLMGEKDTKIALLERAQELSIGEIARLRSELASKLAHESTDQPKAARRKRAFP